MRIRLLHATAALALTLTAACSDSVADPNVNPGEQAELKVLHATAGIGNVDVHVGNQVVISNLSSGRSSAPTTVPAGMQRVRFRQGNTVIADVDVQLTTQHVNVLTLVDGAAQVSSSVTPDTGVAATNRANIRVINVASGITADPTDLQVLINYPGVSSDSTARLGLDTKIASHGPLMYFDPGEFRFRFVPTGTETVLAELVFSVAAGEKRAVMLERNADGSYQAKVIVEP